MLTLCVLECKELFAAAYGGISRGAANSSITATRGISMVYSQDYAITTISPSRHYRYVSLYHACRYSGGVGAATAVVAIDVATSEIAAAIVGGGIAVVALVAGGTAGHIW